MITANIYNYPCPTGLPFIPEDEVAFLEGHSQVTDCPYDFMLPVKAPGKNSNTIVSQHVSMGG